MRINGCIIPLSPFLEIWPTHAIEFNPLRPPMPTPKFARLNREPKPASSPWSRCSTPRNIQSFIFGVARLLFDDTRSSHYHRSGVVIHHALCKWYRSYIHPPILGCMWSYQVPQPVWLSKNSWVNFTTSSQQDLKVPYSHACKLDDLLRLKRLQPLVEQLMEPHWLTFNCFGPCYVDRIWSERQ